METHNLILICLIVIAGFIGGLANYLKNINSDITEPDLKQKGFILWLKYTIFGISAAILVPLFLEMISSNIIDKPVSEGFNKGYFIFMGFCLIAAIFSDRFIDNLADKIFEKANNAEKEAKEATKSVKELQDFATEKEDVELTMNVKLKAAINNNDTLRESYRKIILAITNSKYAYRTLKGISETSGLEKEEVKDLLNQLLKIGILKRRLNKNGNYLWALINTE